ncbi:MAG: hypothetical protein ACLS8Q_04395 [Anaerovoracaceae bacterium]
MRSRIRRSDRAEKMVADGVSCGDGKRGPRYSTGDNRQRTVEDITAGCSDAKAQLADMLSRYMPSDSTEALAGAGKPRSGRTQQFVMLRRTDENRQQ